MKYYNLLNQLEEKGLNVYDLNNASRNVYIEDSYLIGNAPAESENISTIPYDIIFNAIEHHWSMYNSTYHEYNYNGELYDGLHQLIEEFDFESNHTRKLFKNMKRLAGKKNLDYINRIIDTYNQYMQYIIEELESLLLDINDGFIIVSNNELIDVDK